MSPSPPDFVPARTGPLPWYRSAGKVVTAAASTGAAIVSIFSFLYSFGVIGEPESHKTVGTFGASWLGVKPTSDTAYAIGDTLHLAATVTDRSGSVLVGVRPTWTSDNPSAATVEPDGSVIIRGPGATTILVTVANLTARSRIFVRQVVTGVDFGGDSSITMGEGEHRSLTARALDARGFPVRGVPVHLRVSDTTVATVDSLGASVAKNPGRTIVTATASGATAQIPLTVVPVPAAMTVFSGGNQRASVGTALPQPVIVRVTSRRGRAVEGAMVRFRDADGQSPTEPHAALTDSDGRARVTWTLGDMPGPQTLLATVDHVDSALAIMAEAEPVAANTRMVALTDQLSGPVAAALAQPVAVRLTDSTARVLPNVLISWTALDGGRVDALSPRTDSVGEARARWTLGPSVGTQRLRVHVGSVRAIPPLTITASALAGKPARLVLVSGDGQRARAGDELPKPIAVRVTDRSSNPVARVTVRLAPSAGAVGDTAVETDSQGVASTRWTMGRTAGAYTLVVRVDSGVPPLRVSARAFPGAPANLSFQEPPVEGAAGRTLPSKIVAVVTDVYGNPVPNAVVSFATRSGAVSPMRAAADTAGRVRVTWTLGANIGEQALTAAVRGSDVDAKLVVQAVPKTAAPAVQAGTPRTPPLKSAGKPTTGTKKRTHSGSHR